MYKAAVNLLQLVVLAAPWRSWRLTCSTVSQSSMSNFVPSVKTKCLIAFQSRTPSKKFATDCVKRFNAMSRKLTCGNIFSEELSKTLKINSTDGTGRA